MKSSALISVVKWRWLFLMISCFCSPPVPAQEFKPEDYGYRHLELRFKGDPVDVLVKSAGDKSRKKPLLLYCQGSLPVPLMIRYIENGKQGIYNVFPFSPDSLAENYHLVIIGKPFVPLSAYDSTLTGDMTYRAKDGGFPAGYIARNLLGYYVERNIDVLKQLLTQPWAANDRLVLAGHSEGSTVAAKMAADFPQVTQLLYSGGNPLGRMMTLIARSRADAENGHRSAEAAFELWKAIVEDPGSMDSHEDTYGGTFGFTYPAPMRYLEKLTIPVMVTYGSGDPGLVASADYFRLEAIRMKKSNFTFQCYDSFNHDYFPVDAQGRINTRIYGWDRVAADWNRWLKRFR